MKAFNDMKQFWDKKSAIITVVLWLILNFSGIQNLYFTGGGIKTIIVSKLLHLFFLYLIVFIFKAVYSNRKNTDCKHGIVIFGIYMLISIILLLLIWPGAWSWDDIQVLKITNYYGILPWQHFISSFFQIMCLQTLPFATGVIIIQMLIVAMIVGYCVSKVASLMTRSDKSRIIVEIALFITTILSPVLLYVLSGYRMGIYSFIELLLIVRLFIIYKDGNKISLSSLIVLSLLTIIVSSWRTEGIYYLACFFVLLLVMGRKVISLKAVFISFIVCTLITFGIGKVNNYLIGNNDYSITAIIQPLQAVIKEVDKDIYSEELDDINKVINLKMIDENPTWNGPSYFWGGIVRSGYTEEDYSDFLKSSLVLMAKHLDVTLDTMWDIFIKTSGIVVNKDGTPVSTTLVNGSINITNIDTQNGSPWNEVKSMFKDPINTELRNSTIRLLGCIDDTGKITPLYYIFWNLFIPFVMILVCLIYKLFKKDWFMFFLIGTVVARIPLVFVTSSTPFFMYYLSTYLISYFLSFVIIIEFINNIKGKKLNEKKNN